MAAERAWHPALAAAALLALVVVAYLPALQGGFIWDDDVYLTGNANLHSLAGLRRLWLEPGATPQYYPLTFTTFWLEIHLWGLQPFGYHLVNVLLHALNAILLWRLLLLLEVPGAWFAAALFGVHPLHVESVAWITERKNVLSTAFALGAAFCFLQRMRGAQRGRRPWYVASFLLFAAALFSKTVTFILPAALLLVLWWKHGSLPRRAMTLLAPFFALGFVCAAGTAWIERYQVGAHGPEWLHTPLERLLIAGRALWFYAGKVVWPHPLVFNYPAWTIDAAAPWQYVYPLAVVATLLLLVLLRARLGRGPLAAALFFAGALLPVLGLVDYYAMRYSYVADHFAYLPSLGLLALAAGIGATGAKRLSARGRLGLGIAAGMVLLLLVGLTRAQSRAYLDLGTLWIDTLAKNPASWMAHNNFGSLLSESGDLAGAIPHWQEALRLDSRRAEIHQNLGGAAKAQGRIAEAEGWYRKAIQIDPTSASARMNLGVVLTAEGRVQEALQEYEESVQLDPRDATAQNDLGVALAALGRVDEAVRAYRAALALDPDLARAHSNLGLALAAAGKPDEAMVQHAEAVRLAPDLAEAHNNYAITLERSGRYDEAMIQYREVVRLAPSLPEARYNLAAALAKTGHTKEAVAQYHEALRLRPDFEQAQSALALLLGE